MNNPPELDLLRGRTAIVTGAGAIGQAVIATLARAGATVEVWERSPEARGHDSARDGRNHVKEMVSNARRERAGTCLTGY